MAAERRALVLLPCSKSKQQTGRSTNPLLHAIDPALAETRELIRQGMAADPEISMRPANRDGILLDAAPRLEACARYSAGRLYGKITQVQVELNAPRSLWNMKDLDVLIVSAAYGLLQPREAICDYDLQIGERLGDGRVAERWAILSAVLARFVATHNITRVWSLLPGSAGFPYHGVFQAFWSAPRPPGFDARWLCPLDEEGHNARTSAGISRGMWLATVVTTMPESLAAPELPFAVLEHVGGETFAIIDAAGNP